MTRRWDEKPVSLAELEAMRDEFRDRYPMPLRVGYNGTCYFFVDGKCCISCFFEHISMAEDGSGWERNCRLARLKTDRLNR